ncbi:crossover junction endodeoxyribonuclease RuvC [Candidatus Saccharibacteria bacterium]|nr:crossover junction endodeoxyribonuclease RuvC [Candidatus Saccharibacteria bacterium]
MKILGIDPGTATTGFGVIEKKDGKLTAIDCGVISTDKSLAMPERLDILYKDIKELIAHHKPDTVAVEQLFFARNVTTALTVGQARGIVLLSAQQAKLPIREFTPLQVKQSVTGYGQATKKQVQEMVTKILKLKTIPKPDDAADALAIAICCSASNNSHRTPLR